MKVLVSCTESPKKKFEVLDELRLFIDKKVKSKYELLNRFDSPSGLKLFYA
jgi:hypothetical protein